MYKLYVYVLVIRIILFRCLILFSFADYVVRLHVTEIYIYIYIYIIRAHMQVL